MFLYTDTVQSVISYNQKIITAPLEVRKFPFVVKWASPVTQASYNKCSHPAGCQDFILTPVFNPTTVTHHLRAHCCHENQRWASVRAWEKKQKTLQGDKFDGRHVYADYRFQIGFHSWFLRVTVQDSKLSHWCLWGCLIHVLIFSSSSCWCDIFSYCIQSCTVSSYSGKTRTDDSFLTAASCRFWVPPWGGGWVSPGELPAVLPLE